MKPQELVRAARLLIEGLEKLLVSDSFLQDSVNLVKTASENAALLQSKNDTEGAGEQIEIILDQCFLVHTIGELQRFAKRTKAIEGRELDLSEIISSLMPNVKIHREAPDK